MKKHVNHIAILSMIISQAASAEVITHVKDNGFKWENLSVQYPGISFVEVRFKQKVKSLQVKDENGELLANTQVLRSYETQAGKKYNVWKVFTKQEHWIIFAEKNNKNLFFVTEQSILNEKPEFSSIEALLDQKAIINCFENQEARFEFVKQEKSHDRILVDNETKAEVASAVLKDFYKTWDLNIDKDAPESLSLATISGFALVQKARLQNWILARDIGAAVVATAGTTAAVRYSVLHKAKNSAIELSKEAGKLGHSALKRGYKLVGAALSFVLVSLPKLRKKTQPETTGKASSSSPANLSSSASAAAIEKENAQRTEQQDLSDID
jgi:hypothetical protein